MKVKALKKLLADVDNESLVYLQNQDAGCFASFDATVDEDGNLCLTLFSVEQDESIWDN